METYTYAAITHKPTGRQEFFNIKILDTQKAKMLTNASYIEFIAGAFGDMACKELRLNPRECRVSVMPPKGQKHKKYLRVLEGLAKEVVESTTVDLTGPEYQSQ